MTILFKDQCATPHQNQGVWRYIMKKLTVNDGGESFKELIDDFLKEKQTLGRSERTVENYRDSLSRFMKFAGGDVTLSEVNKQLILAYQKHLKDLLPSHYSANSHLRGLRAFLRWAYDNEYLQKPLEVKMIKGQQKLKEVYTEEELIKLLTVPDRSAGFAEWRNWAIINWIMGTGNRTGTVINIRLKDVDLANGTVMITTQKNKRISSHPLDSTLVSVMKTYIKKCRSKAGGEEYLFPDVYGGQMTRNAIRSAVYDYNRGRGVQKTSAHALRHTFAKLYIMNGGDLVRLQKLLGHSSLEMARHYVNLYGPDLKIGFDEKSPLHTLKEKYKNPKEPRMSTRK